MLAIRLAQSIASKLAPTGSYRFGYFAVLGEGSNQRCLNLVGRVQPARVSSVHPWLAMSAQHKQRGAAKLRGKLRRWHGFAEQVALDFVATVVAQEVELRLGFHAFGDHRQF